MKTQGSVASVVATMRDDAAAEVERLEREAQAEVASLQAEPPGSADVPDREERIAAALRESREKLAQEDFRDAQVALEVRERWFAAVAEEGRRILLTPRPREERRALLAKLAREALERLPAGERTLHVPEGDQDLLDPSLLAELDVSAGPAAAISGGCIVRSGRVSVDNSFEERARRFESGLRTTLGKLYSRPERAAPDAAEQRAAP